MIPRKIYPARTGIVIGRAFLNSFMRLLFVVPYLFADRAAAKAGRLPSNYNANQRLCQSVIAWPDSANKNYVDEISPFDYKMTQINGRKYMKAEIFI